MCPSFLFLLPRLHRPHWWGLRHCGAASVDMIWARQSFSPHILAYHRVDILCLALNKQGDDGTRERPALLDRSDGHQPKDVHVRHGHVQLGQPAAAATAATPTTTKRTLQRLLPTRRKSQISLPLFEETDPPDQRWPLLDNFPAVTSIRRRTNISRHQQTVGPLRKSVDSTLINQVLAVVYKVLCPFRLRGKFAKEFFPRDVERGSRILKGFPCVFNEP